MNIFPRTSCNSNEILCNTFFHQLTNNSIPNTFATKSFISVTLQFRHSLPVRFLSFQHVFRSFLYLGHFFRSKKFDDKNTLSLRNIYCLFKHFCKHSEWRHFFFRSVSLENAFDAFVIKCSRQHRRVKRSDHSYLVSIYSSFSHKKPWIQSIHASSMCWERKNLVQRCFGHKIKIKRRKKKHIKIITLKWSAISADFVAFYFTSSLNLLTCVHTHTH